MAKLISQDPSPVELAQIQECLRRGGLLAVPTESHYFAVADASQPSAVQRLAEMQPVAIVVLLRHEREAFDWLPFMAGTARELFRRIPLGSWLVRTQGGADFGLISRLPDLVHWLIRDGERLTFYRPDLPIWQSLFPLAESALVGVPLGSAMTQNLPDLGESAIVIESLANYEMSPPQLLDVDTTSIVSQPDGQPVDALTWGVVRRILFVCTGNTCRSPMAAALCRKLLADCLGCHETELVQRGFCVESGGVAAMPGDGASPEALTVVAELGGDLSQHRSQRLSYEQLYNADHLFAMTQSHLALLQNLPFEDAPVAELLSPEGEDVPDPIGGTQAHYRQCAADILQYLTQRLPDFFRL